MARKFSPHKRQSVGTSFKIEELEPRLLLSADALGGLFTDDGLPAQPAANILVDANLDPANQTAIAADPDDALLELVFVDPATPQYKDIVDDFLTQRKEGRRLEIIVLDPNRDGIEQITEVLEAYDGVDAVHLISHGAAGEVQLGATQLSSASLDTYRSQLQQWNDSLSNDADILIYGCNLAASADGRSLVDTLADITGADVAASDDLTGHASLGADWELEYLAGVVETQNAVSFETQQAWLATLDITSNLVLHLEFEENTGTTAGDSTLNNNDGIFINAPTWDSDSIVGSYSLNFTGDAAGSNSVVSVADDASLDFSGDFTIAFWYNTSVTPSESTRIIGSFDGSNGFSLYADPDGSLNLYLEADGSFTTIGRAGGLIADGNWHHIAVTRMGSSFEIYVDTGDDGATLNFSGGGTLDPAAPLTIGGESATVSDYEGKLDDIRVYTRALSASDVGDLYALSGFGPPAGYSNPGGSNNSAEWITNVNFAGIDNTTGQDSAAYGNYTSEVATVVLEDTNTLSVSIVNDGANSITAWIDWNQDGDFADGEDYVVASSVATNGPHTVNITTPGTASLGTTVMRIGMAWNESPTPDGGATYGEWEDYSINVVNADNLVLHLEFEDGSGVTAGDSTPYGNTGQLNGSAIWTSGEIGGALELNYIDGADFVEIANSPSLENVQEGDFSLAAWFRPDSTPPGTGSDNDAAYGVLIKAGWHTGINYTNANRFEFTHILDGDVGIGVVSTDTFAPGQFYHVAAVLDRTAGTIELYVDGALQGSSTFTPGAASREYGTEPWRVGIASPSIPTFGWAADGAVDDARIYGRTLSAADAAALATPKPSANVAPTGGGSLTSTALNDDAGASTIFGGLTVADPDSGETDLSLRITLSNETAGVIGAGGFVETGPNTGVYISSGHTVASANAALDAATFTPTDGTGATGSFTTNISVEVDDQTAGYQSVLSATTLTITRVADATTVSLTVPAAQSPEEDTAFRFSAVGGNAITVNNGTSPDAVLTGTLTVSNGTLTLASTAGITFLDGTSNGTASIAIAATETDFNAALNGLLYQGNAEFSGADTLTVTVGSTEDSSASVYAQYGFEGGSVTDSSGNGYDGSVVGNPVLAVDAERGDVLVFDGNDRITIPNSTAGLGEEVSIAAWINLDAAQAENVFLSIGDSFYVRLDPAVPSSAGISVRVGSFATSTTGTNKTLVAGEGWTHIAATLNDTTNELKLYVDGVLVIDTNSTFIDVDWPTEPSQDITIGSLSDGSRAFVGSIDDVRVYNRVLTDAEVIEVLGADGYATDSVALAVTAVNDDPVVVADTSISEEAIIDSTVAGASVLASADIDNDGDADLIGASNAGQVLFYINDGSGNFSAGVEVFNAAGLDFTAIASDDLDGDGDIDFVVTNNTPDSTEDGVFIFENQFIGSGTVSFTNRSIESASFGAADIAIADLDGDTRLDIVASYTTSGEVVSYEQNVSGVYTRSVVGTLADVRGIDVADINGDGDLDIAAAGSAGVTWFGNDGTTDPVYTPNNALTLSGIADVAIADFNGDGNLDIGYLRDQFFQTRLGWLANGGGATPSFTPNVTTSLGPFNSFGNLIAADIDGGLGTDLVFTDISANQTLIYTNDGAGNFSLSERGLTPADAQSVDAEDIDGDGDLDLLYAQTSAGAFSLHVNSGNGTFITRYLNQGETLSGLNVQVTDVDAEGADLSVTVSASNGVVSIPTGSVAFTSGINSAASVSFTGTVSEINTALNSFSFTPDDGYTGDTAINIAVDDQGNTGSGGARSGSDSILLSVRALNQAPTGSGSLTTTSLNDNAGASAIFGGLSVADADTGESDLALRITLSDAGAGAILGGGFTETAAGVYLSTGHTVTSANAALDAVAFAPDDNTGSSGNFTTDISVEVDDQTAGYQSVLPATTLTITRINDAPTASDDVTGYASNVLANAPVAYWQLGELTGTAAVNLGSSGVDGTYINGPTLGVPGIAGTVGDTAVDFDGVDDYIDAGTLDVTGTGITLSAWINADSFAPDTDHRIISKGSSSGQAVGDHWWMLSTNEVSGENYLRFRVKAGGVTAELLASTTDLPTGEWLFTTATYDQTSGLMKIFLNGVEIASGSHSQGGAVDTDASRPVWIGANPNDAEYFDGRIDEVAVFDRALTTSQIAQMFDAGRGYLATENSTLTVDAANGVLANDTDPENDPLTAALVSGPSNGSLSLNADGSFEYTPDLGYSGSDSFTYRASDGALNSNTATVAITVDPVNDAPTGSGSLSQVALDDNVGGSTLFGGLTVSDADLNENDLSLRITLSNAAAGTIAGGGFTESSPGVYVSSGHTVASANAALDAVTFSPTPDTGSSGTFTTNISVDVDDQEAGYQSVLPATTVTITRINDAPIAVNDPATAADLLTLDGSAVGFWRLGESSGTVAVDETGNFPGTYSNVTLGASGPFGINTAADFNGIDSRVELGPIDVNGTGLTLAAWVFIDDYDAAADARIISKAGGTERASHTWMLSFDDVGAEHRLRLRVEVDGTTRELVASSGDIVPGGWYHVAATYDEATGEMVLYLDGAVVGTQTGSPGAVAQDPTREVWIGDNPPGAGRPIDGRIDEVAIVERALTPSEIQLLASSSSDSYSVNEATQLSVDASAGVLANDTDVDGDTLSASLVTGPSNAASFSLAADGSFSYTSNTGFSGTDSFVYQVSDGNGGIDTGTATITVFDVDFAPSDLVTTATAGGGLSINQDGGNDIFLQADDGGALLNGLTSLTFETRFSTTDATSQSFVSYATPTNDNEFKLIAQNNGSLLMQVGTQFINVTDFDFRTLNDGVEHTVSYTWQSSGGAWFLYVDGIEVGSGVGLSAGDSIDGGGTLVIGNEQDSPGGGFDPNPHQSATLYDTRLFSGVRSAADIAANFDITLPYDAAGMIANWQFDALSTDGVITDSVSGNNLTVNHIAGAGFSGSEAVLTYGVSESAANGTVVGSVTAIDTEREAQIAALLAADSNLRYSSETGKFYQLVVSNQAWTTASTNALATQLEGVPGQLATVRSAAEQELMTSFAVELGGPVWLGATDQTVEGEWRWQSAGADADQFWQGDGSGFGTGYSNWGSAGEPSNSGGVEHYLFMQTSGAWNDAPVGWGPNYIVEWDADAVLDATQSLSYSIDTQTVPGVFEIDADSGELRVLDGSLLDAAATPVHSVRILTTDGGGNTYGEVFSIGVSAPNVAASGAGSLSATALDDNAGASTLFGGLTVADPDSGENDLSLRITLSDATAGVISGGDFSENGAGTGVYISTSHTVASANAALDAVSFTPTNNTGSTGTFTTDISVEVDDQTAGYQSVLSATTVTITRVNDAPVLAGANNLAAIAENVASASNPGTPVSTLLAGEVTDPDSGALSGIAVTAVDDTNGTWEFTTNGGTSWSAFGAVSQSAALLLTDDANTRVRFQPDANFNGTVTPGITFRAWDQAEGTAGSSVDLTALGTGGTTAFSVAIQSSGITVTAVNNAPVLTSTAGATAYTEQAPAVAIDSGITLTDVDGNNGEEPSGAYTASVAITGDYSPDDILAFTDTARIQGSVSGNTLTLSVIGGQLASLADFENALQSVTFASNSENPSVLDRTVSFTFNDGVANSNTATRTVQVTAVNDAPTGSGSLSTTTLTDNAGATALFGGLTVADPDTGESDLSLRITLSDATAGVISGGDFSETGAGTGIYISTSHTVASANAALDAVSFTPSNNTGSSGSFSADISVDVDDQTTGYQSVLSATTVTITRVNDDPTVATPLLDQGATDGLAFSFTVPAGTFADVDAGDTLTLTARLSGGGALPSWLSFNSGTREFTGTPGPGDVGSVAIDVNADDGNGGTPAVDTFSINVSADPNDAPTGSGSLSSTTLNDNAGDSLIFGGLTVADADAGESDLSVRISLSDATAGAISGGGFAETSAGVYVSSGHTVASANAALDAVSFTPTNNTGSSGTFATDISVEVDDQEAGYQSVLGATTVTVTRINDAPDMPGVPLGATDEDTTFTRSVSSLAGFSSDADAGAQQGLAIVGVDDTNGTWEYTLNGSDWFSIGSVSASNALLLASDATSAFRFVPDANWNGTTGLLSYKAWDQTSGTAGSYVDASTSGGTTAFSSTSGGALTVNAINDNPTGSGSLSSTALNDNAGASAIFGGLSVNDPDSGESDLSLRITLSNASAGAISGGGFSETGVGTGIYVSGGHTVASANGALDAVAFTPTNNTGSSGTFATDIGIEVDDQTAGYQSVLSATTVTITRVNDDPTVATALLDQGATDGVAFDFTVPAGTFADADAGDALTLTAQLSGGAALPSWLSFDSGTREFTGTPGPGDVGPVAIDVIANDGNGGSTAVDTFTITVSADPNDAPTGSGVLTTTSLNDNAGATAIFGGLTIADPDSGENDLSLRITLSDATAGAISGGGFSETSGGVYVSSGHTVASANAALDAVSFAPTNNTGSSGTFATNISVEVDDQTAGYQSVLSGTTVTITRVNDNPTVATPILDQGATDGVAFTFTVPNGTFNDVDSGDTLTLSAQLAGGGALPAWLSFDSGTREFTGTPGPSDVGPVAIDVIADDGNGGTPAVDTVSINVSADPNDAPTGSGSLTTTNMNDNAGASAIFGGLTVSDTDAGESDLSVRITLSDATAGIISGGGFAETSAGVYVSSVHTVASANAALDAVSFTPTNNTGSSGSFTTDISVEVDDQTTGYQAVLSATTVTITRVNDDPTVATALLDQGATDGVPFNFMVPAGTFADVDAGDTLTLTAQLSGGGALPTWLSFNSGTGEFTGTPGPGDVGLVAIDVRADDGNGGTLAVGSFVITVSAEANVAPSGSGSLTTTALNDNVGPSALFVGLTVADPDSGENDLSLRITLSSPGAGVISGGGFSATSAGVYVSTGHTVASANAALDTVSFTATNNTGSSGSFATSISVEVDDQTAGYQPVLPATTVTIDRVNDDPTLVSPLLDQGATDSVPFTFTLPAGTFADADAGDTLTLSAELAGGGALPSWLSFDAGAASFSGTPGAGDIGAVAIDVRADDGNGGTSALDSFSITVSPLGAVNQPPSGEVLIDTAAPTQGDTLTASNTLTDPNGIASSISYQWQRDGNNIAGAMDSSYTTTADDVGTQISVVASFTDGDGNAEAVSSDATNPVASPGNQTPTGTVSITGSASEDGTLTASNTLADPDGISEPIAYQWQRDGIDIVGATGDTLVLAQTDVGSSVTVVATYTDDRGTTESVTSEAIGPVANVNDAVEGLPTIIGTAEPGETLTADTSPVTDEDGIASTEVLWQRSVDDGETWTTVGSGNQYLVAAVDEGAQLRLSAAVVDNFSSEEIVFSETVAVAIGSGGSGSGEIVAPPLGIAGVTDTVLDDDEPDTAPIIATGVPSVSEDTGSGSLAGGNDSSTAGNDSDAPIGEPTTVEDSFTNVLFSGTTPLERAASVEEEAPLPQAIVELIDAAGLAPAPVDLLVPEPPEAPELPERPEPKPITMAELTSISSSDTNRLELQHVDAVTKNYSMWKGIDEMKQSIDDSARYEEEFVVRVVSGSGVGLAAAVAAYTLRGGALVASLLGTIPIWAAYDPLPILSRDKREEEAAKEAAKKAARDAAEDSEASSPEQVEELFR